jgi:hypothetical protein
MDSRYLPSKSFIKRALFLLGLVIIVFLIAKVTPLIKARMKTATLSKILVKDLVNNDSNHNGIQDWEEKLWGLDPKGDGASNKAFINAKKKILASSGETVSAELSENDRISREFFSLVMSLQESGLSNEQILAKISEQIGNQVAVIDVEDIYMYKDISTRTTSRASVIAYRDELAAIMKVCQSNGMGSEMDLVGTALNHDRKDLLFGLPAIEAAYRDCVTKIQGVRAPIELAKLHLSVMNNFEKSAQMLKLIETVFDNQIAGLSGIVSYNEYNTMAISALNDIRDYKLGVIIR